MAHEDAQEKFVDCATANCAPQGSRELAALEAGVEKERRRKEFRGARVSFLGQIHGSFPTKDLHETDSREDARSAELSFYLGHERSERWPDDFPFDYFRTQLPAVISSSEKFEREEYRASERGLNSRLSVSLSYDGGFSYTVAGKISDVCGTIERSAGEVFAFGDTISRNERIPISLKVDWVISIRDDVSDKSDIEFFPVVEMFLEDVLGLAPPTEKQLKKYKSWCSCILCEVHGGIVAGVGQIRERLGLAVWDVIESTWPTAREVYLGSMKSFVFKDRIWISGYGDVPVMVLDLKYRQLEFGQIEFDRFWGGSSVDGETWKLHVRAIRVLGETAYECREAVRTSW